MVLNCSQKKIRKYHKTSIDLDVVLTCLRIVKVLFGRFAKVVTQLGGKSHNFECRTTRQAKEYPLLANPLVVLFERALKVIVDASYGCPSLGLREPTSKQ